MSFSGFISMRVLALGLTMAITPIFAGNLNNYTYLALGDSIPFGYDPTVVIAPEPDKYTGYPEVVAQFSHLLRSKKLVNAACPGETSASFLVLNAPDYGCLGTGPQGQPGFKYSIGLHTMYPGTQAEFAVSQLSTNKHINLVTLSIGANDLLLVAQPCYTAADFAACVAPKLGPVFLAYAQNLTRILTAIRGSAPGQAGYDGTLLLVKYYAPNTIPLFVDAINALNAIMVQVGADFGVKFADGFTAFQLASAPFGGDPCKAGLLVRISSTACDVHPSKAGQQLLAATVLLAADSRN
jgi:lysophospholipase L1-like esterase